MAKLELQQKSLNRKFFRIVSSIGKDYKSNIEFGRDIANLKSIEFSYERLGETYYSSANSIASYISFLKEINVIDEKFKSTINNGKGIDLDVFNDALGDSIMNYLIENNADFETQKQKVKELINSTPAKVTTLENIYSKIDTSINLYNFSLCIRTLAIIRSEIIKLPTKRFLLYPNVIEL